MPKLLIILAVIPIVAAFVIRWWYGIRVLASASRTRCTCDLDLWENRLGPVHLPPDRTGDARQHGALLRAAALEEWQQRDPKASKSREGARRFGMAVPPLALMVAILAMLVGRMNPFYLLPAFLLAIAVSVIISYLSITAELNAILITSRRLRETRIYRRRDDEDAVIEAANALAWKEAAPPVFNLLQR